MAHKLNHTVGDKTIIKALRLGGLIGDGVPYVVDIRDVGNSEGEAVAFKHGLKVIQLL